MISKRNVWVIAGTVVVVLVSGAVLARWQYRRFTTRLQSMPVSIPENLALDPLASVVVDPGLLKGLPDAQARSSMPLLQRYKEHPKYSEARAQLALTWLHGSQLAKDLEKTVLQADRMYHADSIASILSSHATDAWGNGYCVLRHGAELVIISTWNHGRAECESFLQVARELAKPDMPTTLRAGPGRIDPADLHIKL